MPFFSTPEKNTSKWRTCPIRKSPLSPEESLLILPYSDNSIHTGKYTLFSFLGKSLFEQFQRLANIYFLMIAMLMLIGTYSTIYDSPLTPWTTLMPLTFVLSVSLTKEGVEDVKRHKSDNMINSSECEVLQPSSSATVASKWVKIKWQDVRAGDIVRIKNNENFPADLILLWSSEEDGQAFIETANIDGETNLKIRNGANTSMLESEAKCIEGSGSGGNGSIEYEVPNAYIHTFTGTMSLGDGTVTALDSQNVLLRGSTLRNTSSCIGVAIYTGKETKIIMNSRESRTKLANIDITVNTTIYLIMMGQVGLSLLTLFGFAAFETEVGSTLWYICSADTEGSVPANTSLYENCEFQEESATGTAGFFFTFFILYNNFIPISLYVTVEMCNYAHAIFIDNDIKMYDAESDVPAIARTSNLGSDLGQVEYIFSDKTGTLTQNVMNFQKASVANVPYSTFSGSKGCEAMGSLKSKGEGGGNVEWDFISCLGLCHTIVTEKDHETGIVTYKAESPDEQALVSAAKDLGLEFLTRTSKTMTMLTTSTNVTEVYKLHATIPFDSARKRMSVLIETPGGDHVLYCKGADNIMFERCVKEDFEVINRHLGEFASEGLRTLVLAKKVLTGAQFDDWMNAWTDACNTTEGRAEEMAKAAAMIENDLTLVGATAIEDKLQDQVPETIHSLMLAGIKLWVLTGDKMETAINIGYSCKVLEPSMTLIKLQVTNDDPASVKIQLRRLINHFGQITDNHDNYLKKFGKMFKGVFDHHGGKPGNAEVVSTPQAPEAAPDDADSDGEVDATGRPSQTDSAKHRLPADLDLSQLQSQDIALILDGPSLAFVLGDVESEKMLLQIACICKAVIACRVSPSQKAMLVRLVKVGITPMPMCLAIGDGANDVGMIQEAHVGVGISGKEGRQAVNSSDFAIAQFKFLQRLIMLHGRWNYRRLAKCILYSFYKNIVLTFILFYYQFYAGFSGKSLFDDFVYSGYNFFLGMPPLMIGMFDRDMSGRTINRFHKLYMTGRERMDLNVPAIGAWMLQGVVDAALIFFLTLTCTTYIDGGMYLFGTTAYSALILAMMYRIAGCTYTWNFPVIFFWIGSLILYAGIFMPIYSNWWAVAPQFWQTGTNMITYPLFWLILLLIPTTVLIVDLSKQLLYSMFFHTAIDHGIELDRGITWNIEEMLSAYEGDEEKVKRLLKKRGVSSNGDEGPYKWWLAFNDRLPKFNLGKKKLQILNRNLKTEDREAMGIVDTETTKVQTNFAFDHVERGMGLGGGDFSEEELALGIQREGSGTRMNTSDRQVRKSVGSFRQGGESIADTSMDEVQVQLGEC